jgi:hypothetical protein
MAEPIRITAEETRQKSVAGTALLVCAYEDDERCRQIHLQGAMLFTEFKSKLAELPKDQEIIFYCA